jgi:flagellar protein FlgJ
MEAMFIDYMMKVMRETVPKSDMDLESPTTEIYRGMLDAETSQRAAKSGGVGIADQIIAYLESQKYTLPKGQMGRQPSPHGTQQAVQQAVTTVSRRSNEASAGATMSTPSAPAANGIGGTTHENY